MAVRGGTSGSAFLIVHGRLGHKGKVLTAQDGVKLATAVVVDGKVLEDGLAPCGLDRGWLDRQLRTRGTGLEQVVLAVVHDDDGRLYLDIKEDREHPRPVH